MSDPRDLLITVSAICGVLMVAGAFGLLYRGMLTLDAPPGASATEVDFMKILKLKTNVAALVLFAFGFGFLALGFSNIRKDAPHFAVTGRLSGIKAGESVTVTVCGGPWEIPVTNREIINHVVKPDLDSFTVQIGRPGGLIEKNVGVAIGARRAKYGFVRVDKDAVADLGEIALQTPAAPVPTAVDLVTGQPAPSVRYVR